MKEKLLSAARITVILTGYIGIGVICFFAGKAKMHEELTDDMKRYNDPPIPALTTRGDIYMYSPEMDYLTWEKKSNELWD